MPSCLLLESIIQDLVYKGDNHHEDPMIRFSLTSSRIDSIRASQHLVSFLLSAYFNMLISWQPPPHPNPPPPGGRGFIGTFAITSHDIHFKSTISMKLFFLPFSGIGKLSDLRSRHFFLLFRSTLFPGRNQLLGCFRRFPG